MATLNDVTLKDGVKFAINTNFLSEIQVKTDNYFVKLSKKTIKALLKCITARIVIQVIKDGVDIYGKKLEKRSDKTTGNEQIDLVNSGKLLTKIRAAISRETANSVLSASIETAATVDRSLKKKQRPANYGYVLMFGRSEGKKETDWDRVYLYTNAKGVERYKYIAKKWRKYPAIPERLWCGFSPNTAELFLNNDLIPFFESLVFQRALLPFRDPAVGGGEVRWGVEYIGTAVETVTKEIETMWKNSKLLEKQAKSLIKSHIKKTKVVMRKKVM